ncbi:MAG: hypothetical protein NHB32_31750, partial [Fischerella sp. CENA71]|nr:hypothetical protein [Fischerella sp. CENA71]
MNAHLMRKSYLVSLFGKLLEDSTKLELVFSPVLFQAARNRQSPPFDYHWVWGEPFGLSCHLPSMGKRQAAQIYWVPCTLEAYLLNTHSVAES